MALQVHIEGEDEVTAGARFDRADRANLAPGRVELHLPEARRSAQDRFVDELHPRLAEPVVQFVAVVLQRRVLVGVDPANVAQLVRGEAARGIETDRLDQYQYAGGLRLALSQPEGGLFVQILPHDDGDEWVGALLRCRNRGDDLLRWDIGDGREPRGERLELVIRHIGRDDGGGENGRVEDELLAVAVEDEPSRGQLLEDSQAVGFGARQVLVVIDDLQPHELEREDAEEEHDERLEDQEAVLERGAYLSLRGSGAPATPLPGRELHPLHAVGSLSQTALERLLRPEVEAGDPHQAVDREDQQCIGDGGRYEDVRQASRPADLIARGRQADQHDALVEQRRRRRHQHREEQIRLHQPKPLHARHQDQRGEREDRQAHRLAVQQPLGESGDGDEQQRLALTPHGDPGDEEDDEEVRVRAEDREGGRHRYLRHHSEKDDQESDSGAHGAPSSCGRKLPSTRTTSSREKSASGCRRTS